MRSALPPRLCQWEAVPPWPSTSGASKAYTPPSVRRKPTIPRAIDPYHIASRCRCHAIVLARCKSRGGVAMARDECISHVYIAHPPHLALSILRVPQDVASTLTDLETIRSSHIQTARQSPFNLVGEPPFVVSGSESEAFWITIFMPNIWASSREMGAILPIGRADS